MKRKALKKWGMKLGIVSMAMLTLATMPIYANAEEDPNFEEVEYKLDNNALYDQYIDHLMSLQDGIAIEEYNCEDSDTGYYAAKSALTKYGKTVYEILKSQIIQVANGERESAKFSIPYSSIYGADDTFTFSASEIGMTQITDSNKDDALIKVRDYIHNTAKEPGFGKVYDAIVADVPYYLYWSSGSTSLNYPQVQEVSHTDDSITVKPREGGSYELNIVVSDTYAKSDFEVDINKTSVAKNALANASDIVNQAKSLTDSEKLTYYKNSICNLVDYAFGTWINSDHRQIIYVFDNDSSTKVVCEGYAKAFKYLCDLTEFSSSEVECRLAAGYLDVDNEAPERHMWNVVQLKNNENYLVDVTNCDDGMFGAPDILFMKGESGKVYQTVNDQELWGYKINHPSYTVCYYYDDSNYNNMRSESELTLIKEQNSDDQEQETGGDAKAFVKRLYRVALGRDAEEQGLNDWTRQLTSGEKNAVDIVQGVLCSQEYGSKGKSNGEIVNDCYQSMLGRAADEGGYADWTSRLDSGMSVNAIFAGFVGSEEFGKLCASYGIKPGNYTLTEARDMNAGVTKFVSRLYTKALGREYDVAGLNDWCGKINANPSRENILNISTNGFFHSQEFTNKNLNNTEFVKVLYRTFLGREYDDAGLANWVGQLDRGEYTRDGVISGFANSQEFSNIMAQYGL
ncbi:protein of unknown function [Butyrivibrio proteoclasticus]|uniref:DUF4214 domain-containing protein n=1 Tax=Butyrivibrio proteoclasticus TaxID=43305 RepID=A0A1I5WR50_9FIRM|nr:DUF4214 domain-containing protein [Butyrivibrio proteoclasticus]SFQ22244.1 protein of unknown function [Butyrivibrio proteoclasticus]